VGGSEGIEILHYAILKLVEEIQFPKLDGTALSIVSSFDESERQDREYWRSRTPYERLAYMELLQRINYGPAAAARLQRVLEVVERVGDEVKVI
jgi:hypothetical protein